MQQQQHFRPNAADASQFGGGFNSANAVRQPTPPATFQLNTVGLHGSSSSGNVFGDDAFGSTGGFYNAPVQNSSPPQMVGSAFNVTTPPAMGQPSFFGGADFTIRSGSATNAIGSSIQGTSSVSNNNNNSAGMPSAVPVHQTRFGFPEDDLPLLQELGIFPHHIRMKAMAVLNPRAEMSADVIEDMDLAGPVTFAVSLGFLLSLQGKVQFGAIYGLSLIGIFFAKMLLSLMSDHHSAPLQFVVSTLGYCLLPNLVLAVVQTFQYWLIGSHAVIMPLAFVVVGWSAWCATTMFVKAMAMEAQRYLVLYPCVIFYAVFAALTIF